MRYAKKFKESVVQNYYQSGMSLKQFSSRAGINRETLCSWLESAPSVDIFKTPEVFLDKNIHDKERNWSPEDKIWAVFKCEELSTKGKGFFLRKYGLYSSHVYKWKNEMLNGLLVGKKNLNKFQKYEKEIRAQRAIIDLQKKIQKSLEVEG